MRVGEGSAVRLDGVAKRYRRTGTWVLSDVSAEVVAGSITRVDGRNGAGKSTLLRIVAGATAPTRGRRAVPSGSRVGYAPERFAPAPPFTVAGFLRHHVRLRQLGAEEGHEQCTELAARLGFERLTQQRLGDLSKGSLQKVVLSQALLGAPTLLVLDEPFAGLDTDAHHALCGLLRERAQAGGAVLFSDHGDAGARLAPDHRWRVAEGRVALEAAPGDDARSAVTAMPGVQVLDAAPACIRVTAGVETSDRVLAVLLSEGWHVERVRAPSDALREIAATRQETP